MQVQMPDIRSSKRASRLLPLIRLYESGQASERMDRTLDKLLSAEEAETKGAIRQLRADLDEFEQQYSMESAAFYAKFAQGEMGDDMEYVTWASLFQMYTRAVNRLRILTEAE